MVKKAFVVALAIVLAGCSARMQLDTGAGIATSSGTSITSGSAGLHVHAGSNSFAAALVAIALLAGAIEYSRDPRPFPSPSALLPDATPAAPQLAPGRIVNEQDCSRPIADPSANLKCR